MELSEAVRRRHMVRSFGPDPRRPSPVAPEIIDGLIDLARRTPSAGNTGATSFVVLDQPEAVARYWDATLPEPRRSGFRWPGLVVAPVLVLVTVRPQAYVERYAEPDKASTGLGEGLERWPVPYWWVDAGAAVEHVLLGAVAAGLGACLFGAFEHEPAVAEAFGLPDGWRLVATIAIGHRVANDHQPVEEAGRSVGRPRRSLDEVIHRNHW